LPVTSRVLEFIGSVATDAACRGVVGGRSKCDFEVGERYAVSHVVYN
jgi:hypothetical protein